MLRVEGVGQDPAMREHGARQIRAEGTTADEGRGVENGGERSSLRRGCGRPASQGQRRLKVGWARRTQGMGEWVGARAMEQSV